MSKENEQAAPPEEDDDLFGLAAAGLAMAGLWKLGESLSKSSRKRSHRRHTTASANLVEQGRRFQRDGRLTPAAEAFRQALAANPDNSEAANELAWLLATNTRTRDGLLEARRLAEHAIGNAPGDADRARYFDTLAEANLRLGNDHEAISNLEHCLQLLGSTTTPPAPFALFRLGLVLARNGEFVKAQKALEAAVAAAPGNIDIRVLLARVTRDLFDYPRAISELQQALEVLEQSWSEFDSDRAKWATSAILTELAATFRLAGRDNDAVNACREAMAVCETNPYPFAGYALIAGKRGSLEEMRRYLGIALFLAPREDVLLNQHLVSEAVHCDYGDQILDMLHTSHRITPSELSAYREEWLRYREEVRQKDTTTVNIKEYTSMDTHNENYNYGTAGVVGQNYGQVRQQINDVPSSLDVDLQVLARELMEVKARLLSEAKTADHYRAIAEIEEAKNSAENSDPSSVLKHLAAAGRWVLDLAKSIGAPVAVAALRVALGV